jgi:hypothetical protein
MQTIQDMIDEEIAMNEANDYCEKMEREQSEAWINREMYGIDW